MQGGMLPAAAADADHMAMMNKGDADVSPPLNEAHQADRFNERFSPMSPGAAGTDASALVESHPIMKDVMPSMALSLTLQQSLSPPHSSASAKAHDDLAASGPHVSPGRLVSLDRHERDVDTSPEARQEAYEASLKLPIPTFYHPKPHPLQFVAQRRTGDGLGIAEEDRVRIDEVYAACLAARAEAKPHEPHAITAEGKAGAGLRLDEFEQEMVVGLLGLSKYFAGVLFHQIAIDGVVTKDRLLRYWSSRLLGVCKPPSAPEEDTPSASGGAPSSSEMDEAARYDRMVMNFFNVVRAPTNEYIEKNDLRPFVKELLNRHPGLEFLHDTPEFQERYADTVIARIHYVCERRGAGKICFKDLRRSCGIAHSVPDSPVTAATPIVRRDIVSVWKSLDSEDDINKVRDFFSYEHFYVLYCKFWELDQDHDFLIDKEDLLRYDNHSFSRRAIERIFTQVPMAFTSTVPGKMGYEDFIWFLISDEDKTTDRSLEFWFRLVDLDGDGCIRDHEMYYFYEEQMTRLECFNHETVPFQDVLCQMCDMIDPSLEGHFRLSDFKRQRKLSGTFFSILLSLNKFLNYEQRDPFAIKQEQAEHPGFSDWDRYCATEYLRLASEDDSQEDDMHTLL